MTERLTEEWYDDMEQFDRYAPKSPNIEINCGGDDFQDIIDKLAEYETAEDEGRLVVLPCKPWDKVYALFIIDVIDKKPIYKIFQTKVTKITIDRFRVLFSFETLDQNKYNSERTMEAFGETVFLTREEAEKALKEMEENHE